MVSIIYSNMNLKFNSLSINSFLTKSSSSQFGRAMKSENQAFVSEEHTLEHLNDVHHRLLERKESWELHLVTLDSKTACSYLILKPRGCLDSDSSGKHWLNPRLC